MTEPSIRECWLELYTSIIMLADEERRELLLPAEVGCIKEISYLLDNLNEDWIEFTIKELCDES